MYHQRRLTTVQIANFRRLVYAFFRKHKRDLPWRHTTDPYRIFVSEVMLQQTQVDRVAVKFVSFTQSFPTWSALAKAPLDQVLAEWQGMGYNRRARFLKLAAIAVVKDHGGRLPDDPDQLKQLPGIGTATAASIAAFAFNKPTVFIETNIRSVFIHHFFRGKTGIDDTRILPLVEQTLDRKQPARWYSALMDYGTALKKVQGNPSRRSRHHHRQSRFEGSTRQMRGRILKMLLERGPLSDDGLSGAVGASTETLTGVLGGLVRDNLVCLVRGRYAISR
jgi:A/G-specific adenine glycosylase